MSETVHFREVAYASESYLLEMTRKEIPVQDMGTLSLSAGGLTFRGKNHNFTFERVHKVQIRYFPYSKRLQVLNWIKMIVFLLTLAGVIAINVRSFIIEDAFLLVLAITLIPIYLALGFQNLLEIVPLIVHRKPFGMEWLEVEAEMQEHREILYIVRLRYRRLHLSNPRNENLKEWIEYLLVNTDYRVSRDPM